MPSPEHPARNASGSYSTATRTQRASTERNINEKWTIKFPLQESRRGCVGNVETRPTSRPRAPRTPRWATKSALMVVYGVGKAAGGAEWIPVERRSSNRPGRSGRPGRSNRPERSGRPGWSTRRRAGRRQATAEEGRGRRQRRRAGEGRATAKEAGQATAATGPRRTRPAGVPVCLPCSTTVRPAIRVWSTPVASCQGSS